MLKPGVLHILMGGLEHFTIDTWEHEGKVAVAAVTPLPAEPAVALPAEFGPQAEFLRELVDAMATTSCPRRPTGDDTGWLGMRLVQLLCR